MNLKYRQANAHYIVELSMRADYAYDADVITMTFIVQLMDTIKWIDEDASGLSREDILDKVRARLVDITHKFVAYPHCANFSLMPEGGK